LTDVPERKGFAPPARASAQIPTIILLQSKKKLPPRADNDKIAQKASVAISKFAEFDIGPETNFEIENGTGIISYWCPLDYEIRHRG
jgi:hypothetical protein